MNSMKNYEMLFYERFITAHEESSTCFHYFQYNDGKNIALTLLVSVIVNEHLHIKVFVSSVFIPQSKYGYLITSEKNSIYI